MRTTDAPPAAPPPCPRSATHGAVALAGIAAFVASTAAVRAWQPSSYEIGAGAGLVVAACALAVLGVDAACFGALTRPSTGIDYRHDDPSLARTAVKFVGLLASLAFVGFGYWLFPEYHGAFYGRYYALLKVVVPVLVLLAPVYLYVVDRHQVAPRDGLYQFGALCLGRPGAGRAPDIGQHLLGWLIKGFFLPLMYVFFCNDLERFVHRGLSVRTFIDAYNAAYDYLYFVDVGIVSMGYLVALRIVDTHLRSAEPTMLGWTAALVCYEPFWSLVGDRYLAYGNGYAWGNWFGAYPALYVAWGSVILALTAVYVWATVSFGARFSNLTHRGIITNGPYRYLRHPAYVSKNLSWWMISMPFLWHGSWHDAARRCAALLAVNGVYALRAWTEERHLARDPTYVAYRDHLRATGLAARARRIAGW